MATSSSMVSSAMQNLTSGLFNSSSSASGSSSNDYAIANIIQQMPQKHEQKVKEEEQEARARVSGTVQTQRSSSQYQMG